MCDPVTLAVVAGGAQIGQTVVGYQNAKKAARDAQALIRQQAGQNYQALAQRRLQEQQAAAQQSMTFRRQARLAQGSQIVSGGFRGAGGRTFSTLIDNVNAQEARAMQALRVQQSFLDTALRNQNRSIELGAQASMLNARDPALPVFELIGNIAGAGANTLKAMGPASGGGPPAPAASQAPVNVPGVPSPYTNDGFLNMS